MVLASSIYQNHYPYAFLHFSALSTKLKLFQTYLLNSISICRKVYFILYCNILQLHNYSMPSNSIIFVLEFFHIHFHVNYFRDKPYIFEGQTVLYILLLIIIL